VAIIGGSHFFRKKVAATFFMKNKYLLFWVILVVFTYACAEGLCLAGLAVLDKTRHIKYAPLDDFELNADQKAKIRDLLDGKMEYLSFDAGLGWTIKPDAEKGIYRSNAQGLRAGREYSFDIPDGKTRIAAFGDSYTHGDEVDGAATWQAQMEALDPGLEVLNFGVPGYGLDQAYLRYTKIGRAFQADIVLIGYFTTDIYRHVNTFRPYFSNETGVPLAKPRYRATESGVELIENPIREKEEYRRLLDGDRALLRELGKNDHFYTVQYRVGPWDFLPSVRLIKLWRHYDEMVNKKNRIWYRKGKGSIYNHRSEAFMTTLAIMDLFYNDVEAAGAVPVIVIFPAAGDILDYYRTGLKSYDAFLWVLEKADMAYIDLMDGVFAGARDRIEDYFVDSHYSPYGNQQVAETLVGLLPEKISADQ